MDISKGKKVKPRAEEAKHPEEEPKAEQAIQSARHIAVPKADGLSERHIAVPLADQARQA